MAREPVRKIVRDANTRAKIQATQVINRLHAHMMGEVEMSASQVKAAEILLKKPLPDLQATTLSTDSGTLSDILKDLSGETTGLPEPIDESRAVH